MIYTGASIRELQLARGLITLRWTSIPLLFGFSLFCLDFLNLSFKFEPIYLLCCALAIFNVYFTVHVSLLSRQMALNSGMSTLKRGLVRIAFEPLSIIRKKGVLGIIAIPKTVIKLIVCMYLMLLEAMKDVPFNPFSIKNIIKTQIVVDLAIILLLVRFTGTTESPVLLLTAVPVLVAGAISGVKTGFFFAFLTTFAWLTTGFMVKHQIIPHIKFYSPVYGDLSQCTEWIYANSSVLFFTLCSVAFLGNRITNYLNQRISSLNSLLLESNTRAYASNFASEQQKDAWLITDEKTNIEKIKIDSRHFFSPSVLGLNLRETYSELESKLTDVFIKNLIENRQRCRVEKVKLQSSEDKSYVFDICLTSFIDCDDKNKLLLFFEDNTVEENSKTKVIELKNEIQALNEKLENLNNENTKNNNLIINLQDTINSRIVDMELLNKKISDLTLTRIENERNISELISELAGVKASNDEMIATLECKQMLLNEAATLIDFCGNLTELIKKIESNTKELFSLKNSHLHIFTSENLEERYEEIITLEHFQTTTSALTKAGPSLLNPAFSEGRPVIISAEIKPEKSAALSYKNGELEKLIAYVPIRHDNETLGMMILEKFGNENRPEVMMEMLSYYLKYASTAIKNAILNRNVKRENSVLNKELETLKTEISSFKRIIGANAKKQDESYEMILEEFSKLIKIEDAILIKQNRDESTEIACRFNKRRLHILNETETEILNHFKENPDCKATFELKDYRAIGQAFPLVHNKRLLGALIIYYSDSIEPPDEFLLEFCVNLLKYNFTLNILSQENEVMESFYAKTVAA